MADPCARRRPQHPPFVKESLFYQLWFGHLGQLKRSQVSTPRLLSAISGSKTLSN
jgi:hypothetical protein